MLSNNKIKFLTSLQNKKHRDESGLYIAEGRKILLEIISTGKIIHSLFCLEEWYRKNAKNIPNDVDITIISTNEMKKISSLTTPQDVLSVMYQDSRELIIDDFCSKLSIALDGIQDPGNMGTILRIADWFGIEHILCSFGCVDVYNPKVIQASMGALCRTRINYTNLPIFLLELKRINIPIFGTFLDGDNIYTHELPKQGIIVFGNEGNGICPDIEAQVTHRIHIPSFRTGNSVESLNVSVAAAIVCSEFKRRV